MALIYPYISFLYLSYAKKIKGRLTSLIAVAHAVVQVILTNKWSAIERIEREVGWENRFVFLPHLWKSFEETENKRKGSSAIRNVLGGQKRVNTRDVDMLPDSWLQKVVYLYEITELCTCERKYFFTTFSHRSPLLSLLLVIWFRKPIITTVFPQGLSEKAPLSYFHLEYHFIRSIEWVSNW